MKPISANVVAALAAAVGLRAHGCQRHSEPARAASVVTAASSRSTPPPPLPPRVVLHSHPPMLADRLFNRAAASYPDVDRVAKRCDAGLPLAPYADACAAAKQRGRECWPALLSVEEDCPCLPCARSYRPDAVAAAFACDAAHCLPDVEARDRCAFDRQLQLPVSARGGELMAACAGVWQRCQLDGLAARSFPGLPGAQQCALLAVELSDSTIEAILPCVGEPSCLAILACVSRALASSCCAGSDLPP